MLKCPICGELRNHLTKHVNMAHKMTKEEFLKRYPGTQMISSETSQKISEALVHNWATDPEYRKNCSKYWNSSEHAQRHSEWMKRSYQDPKFREKMIRAQESGVTEAELLRRSSLMKQISNKLWSDPEYRKLKSEQAKAQWSNPEWVSKLRSSQFSSNIFNKSDGSSISMRSSWEVTVASELDKLGIEFDYETLQIRYDYEEWGYVDKIYIPDFYLPLYNLILEVHPYELDPEIMNAKGLACLREGYNFEQITNDIEYLHKILDKYN